MPGGKPKLAFACHHRQSNHCVRTTQTHIQAALPCFLFKPSNISAFCLSQAHVMLPVSRGLIGKSAPRCLNSRASSPSHGSLTTLPTQQGAFKSNSSVHSGAKAQWMLQTSAPSLLSSSIRSFSSSTACRSKAQPRQSIHKFKGEEERLDTDEQFIKILDEQKKFVAEHRTAAAVRAAGGDPNAEAQEEETANLVRLTDNQIRDDRRAIIAKMVAKHVPLKDVPKAVDMFNTLIYGFLKSGNIHDAEEVFGQMDANDIPASKATYHMLAKAYSTQSPPMIESLQKIMDLMGSSIGTDVFIFNTLISSYAAIRRTCHAPAMFELMRSHDVVEDITTCNVLLMNYGRLTDGTGLQHAEDVLLWMRNMNIRPDDTTYTALINCCYGDLDRALDFYEASLKAAEAGEVSNAANEERLTGMLRVFASVRQLEQGQIFLTEFITKYPTFKLSAGNYGALFYLYVNCLQIKQAFDDLDAFLFAVSPNVPVSTCRQVIAGLRALPEAILPENEDILDEWDAKLDKYKVRFVLSQGDAAHWKICLIRWREVYVPTPGRNPTL